MNENEIGKIVVDCAVKLHMSLGPGLLESVYEVVLAKQLMLVNGSVILELKSIEKILPVHKKQLLTYLKLTNMKLGYLLNFGDELMKNGITRTINGQL